jgi:hypothetical protein
MTPSDTSPIVPSAASNDPILVEAYEDLGSCCVQWMPASQVGFYLKFVLAVCAVFGAGSFGLYMLLEYFAK